MQVNEADIARVHKGQTAHFTVDAFPGQQFEGKVQQVRPNAQMTQNVVTYTVVVATDNSSGKLLPYLDGQCADRGRPSQFPAATRAPYRQETTSAGDDFDAQQPANNYSPLPSRERGWG